MGTLLYGQPTETVTDAAVRREALILQHLPQVRLIARRVHERLPAHINVDDLVSAGVLGLLSAIDNFDPAMNVQLKTYADRKIHGAILESLRQMDWAPRDVRKKSRLIASAIRILQQRLGREPLEEEIAAELNLTQGDYHAWLTDMHGIELRRLETAAGDRERNLLNILPDEEESWPSRLVERAELERVLKSAVERMPKVERTVLSLYYFEELTLREIADIMGLHLSRIGQLRALAVLRLRGHMERVWPAGSRQVV
jgi:RNA polymerase sigma factor for flagellar operon FliA